MAINRYQGNSGRVQRIAEPDDQRRHAPPLNAQTRQPGQNIRPPNTAQNSRPPRHLDNRGPGGLGGLGSLGGLFGSKGLGGILSKFTNLQLETEDIILLLILWLMYRESHDEELLIIAGALLFL